MSGRTNRLTAETMLLELSDPGRVSGGVELASLLEAWGFVRSGRLDGEDPETALFYIHPEHPFLHMSIPIGGPLPRYVMDYAFHLVRSVENRAGESADE
ncbi:MAG TPA: hypothetical protein VNG35_00575 [Gemmatimonadales bacterium]|nr:hypothetical protein [Gemmatimonadales bacterium]